MNPRARKLLWVLLAVLLIGSLFLAGPAHQLVHSDADGLASCDFCHFASPEAPHFESFEFCLVQHAVARTETRERIRDFEVPEQGHARAPPRQG